MYAIITLRSYSSDHNQGKSVKTETSTMNLALSTSAPLTSTISPSRPKITFNIFGPDGSSTIHQGTEATLLFTLEDNSKFIKDDLMLRPKLICIIFVDF